MNTLPQDEKLILQSHETLLRQKLMQEPESALTQNNLGFVLRLLGKSAEAEALLRKAVAALPQSPEVAFNWGLALADERRTEEAEAAFRRALELRPVFPEARFSLGNVVKLLGRLTEAEGLLRDSLSGLPDPSAAHAALAELLGIRGRYAQSEAEARRALALKPDLFEAHSLLALALNALGQWPEAEAAMRQALSLRPECSRSRVLLALIVLRMGRYAEGFELFEARFDEPAEEAMVGGASSGGQSPQEFMWRGESLEGKSVLILPEQGLGDVIQFVRFAPRLRELGAARITVCCYPELVQVLRQVDGIDLVVSVNPPVQLSKFDVCCYVMSLPLRLGITLDTLRPATRYIDVPEENRRSWQHRLNAFSSGGKRKIGLVWNGSTALGMPGAEIPTEFHDNAQRSIPLERFSPLLDMPNCAFFSLQVGMEASQLAQIPAAIRPANPMRGVTDFLDTAAMIEQLDLVISVDTAVAHLAGALGKPVWILSRFNGDWRWPHGREDSPWYASARVFTQKIIGDWDEVIARVADALSAFAAA